MGAIYRREMSSYFYSPVAYVFIVVLLAFTGYIFTFANIFQMNADMSITFSNIFLILMVLLPILTMRLFSEEKRQKTEQGLLTAPVTLLEIVLGKFFAALTVYTVSIAIYIVYALVLAALGASVEWAIIFGNLLGLFLLGAAFISAGVFISSTTENQVVAAVGTFVLIFLLYSIDAIGSIITKVPFLQQVCTYLSFYSRYNELTNGIFNITSILFFVSVTAVFLFLTVRVFEKRRWS